MITTSAKLQIWIKKQANKHCLQMGEWDILKIQSWTSHLTCRHAFWECPTPSALVPYPTRKVLQGYFVHGLCFCQLNGPSFIHMQTFCHWSKKTLLYFMMGADLLLWTSFNFQVLTLRLPHSYDSLRRKRTTFKKYS